MTDRLVPSRSLRWISLCRSADRYSRLAAWVSSSVRRSGASCRDLYSRSKTRMPASSVVSTKALTIWCRSGRLVSHWPPERTTASTTSVTGAARYVGSSAKVASGRAYSQWLRDQRSEERAAPRASTRAARKKYLSCAQGRLRRCMLMGLPVRHSPAAAAAETAARGSPRNTLTPLVSARAVKPALERVLGRNFSADWGMELLSFAGTSVEY